MTLSHPASIGRYEILGRLGTGAMGEVYHARDRSIGREVALKTYRAGPTAEGHDLAMLRKRLLREARSAGKLSHPNIVAVFDVVELDDGTGFYIVMEYVEGVSLGRLLHRRKRLPITEALALFDQIAAAVDHLHDRGLVHRDLKPANILVTPAGQVKVADFGVALPSDPLQTQETTVFGTPQYMAPEQIQGRPADHRTDIFALGVLLYEMITGARPYEGRTVAEVTHSILHQGFTPPDHYLEESLPQRIQGVLNRALAKVPEERFSSAGAMVGALRGVAPSAHELDAAETAVLPELATSRVSHSRTRPLLAWTLLVVVLLGAGSGLGALYLNLRGSPLSTLEGEATAHHAAYLQLITEGRRLLADDDPDGAVVLFGTAAELAGDPAEASELREEARREVVRRGAAARLRAARRALDAGRYDDAIAGARELIASDTTRAEALEILTEVETALGRPQPTSPPAIPSSDARPSVPSPAGSTLLETTEPPLAAPSDRLAANPPAPLPSGMGQATLVVEMVTRAREGILTLYVGDRQVLLEPFSFGRRRWFRPLALGRVDTEIPIPADVSPLKVLLARSDQVPILLTYQTSFAPGSRRRLEVELPAVGKPIVTLR